jgi:uncharacterized protein (DUF885 family)
MKAAMNVWVCLGVCVLVSGCATLKESRSVPAAEVFAEYFDERLKLYPMEATLAGDHRYDDQLPNNLTEEFRAREKAFYQKYLAAVRRLDRSRLSAEEQLSRDILEFECETQLERLRFPGHLLPINQFESLHLSISQWAGGASAQPFRTVRDYENWLKRLEAFTAWCDTAVDNMRAGLRRGYVLPRALTVKVIPQMAAMTRLPATEHPYYAPIRNMPESIGHGERERLAKAYAAMIESRIVPAYRRLETFLRDEYLPASRTSSGISAVPGGADYYRAQVRAFTTTDLTADEIHDLGKREVARLLGEMNKVRETVGFRGDMKSFFEFVRTNSALTPFHDPQQVLSNFHAIHRRMQPAVARLFSLTPRTPFEIRRTEAFREATASAEWMEGSLDGTRPGIFYVPVPNVREYNVSQDESLFLHEAIPGHHYQLSLQRENEVLPMFRRVGGHSVFAEGWALYCESLGKELGLYDDPYQYFGMLSMEMHRAIRLVVDTGLHAKGWTREQAIQYSLDHEAETEAGIIAEIERYMAWPGQALAYKVGQLKIRELRSRAEQKLGANFDIREFHTQVLESGCMPLSLLERKINRWMATRISRMDTESAGR